jgi:hypothetical protein
VTLIRRGFVDLVTEPRLSFPSGATRAGNGNATIPYPQKGDFYGGDMAGRRKMGVFPKETGCICL